MKPPQQPPIPKPSSLPYPDRPPNPTQPRPTFPFKRSTPTRSRLPDPTFPTLQQLTPLPWTSHFDNSTDLSLPTRNAIFRVYDAGLTPTTDLALIFLHGAGHAALSWALVAANLKPHVAVVAFDARGHGHSRSDDDTDLSAETQVDDAAVLIAEFFQRKMPQAPMPRLVVCGHSMGGAVAIRLCAARVLETVVGLVVVDVVEGTAMTALPYMTSWLQGRPCSFRNVEGAVRYVTKAGHVRNVDSARVSVPAQVEYREKAARWVWRTDLEQSERYWPGWFSGLSSLFLSVPAAKLLVLANVDRLDKDLMIAQMQGKFQNILIPEAGHTVHEDKPEQTARVILDYLQRNLFLARLEDEQGGAIFQQRSPIPPCC